MSTEEKVDHVAMTAAKKIDLLIKDPYNAARLVCILADMVRADMVLIKGVAQQIGNPVIMAIVQAGEAHTRPLLEGEYRIPTQEEFDIITGHQAAPAEAAEAAQYTPGPGIADGLVS